jgi:hypothetical protein
MTRRRYRWNEETRELEELGADYEPAPRRAQTPTEQLVYGGLQATDGADISSRKKHREYMRRNGLTTADDFKQTWENAAKERAKFYQGDFDTRERRETIARIWDQKYKP